MSATLQKAKGPAALAGAPDHGSIHPGESFDMNKHSNITALPGAASTPFDPMLEAIKAYRIGLATMNAIPIEFITKDNEDEIEAATFLPAQELILRNPPHTPKVTSLAGVRESIRMTFEIEALIDCMAKNALREALAYLDEVAA